MVDHADEEPDEGAAGQAEGGERVAKALARAGVASRRDVERYIAAGRVALNGKVLDTPAVKVAAGDILAVDGEVVDAAEPTRVWRHHKPVGLLTSHGDPQGRPTVFDHLPEGLPRVISVGRLDINSEGLLLLTNDGELARALELPGNGWRRVYRVRAHGRADQAKLDKLKAGATIEGVRYGPVEARIDKATGEGAVGRGKTSDAPANLWLTVSVEEGKNREVRRVLESVGLKVNRLIRLAYGPFALGTLPVGAVEEVGPRVLREQLAGLVPAEKMPTGDRRPPTVSAPKPRRAAEPPPRRELPSKPRGTLIDPPDRRGRGGKPGPRPTGAAGRTSGAWTPPGERKGKPGAGRPSGPGGPAARAGEGRGPSRASVGAEGRSTGAGKPPGGKPAFGRSGAEKPRFDKPRFDKPRDGKPSSGKPGAPRPGAAKPGPTKPAAGKAPGAAAAERPKSAGMELTPPMRRSFKRGPAAKRPPRKD